jgi:hypothetical protein
LFKEDIDGPRSQIGGNHIDYHDRPYDLVSAFRGRHSAHEALPVALNIFFAIGEAF